jgi:N-methylhydantoinase A
MIESDIYDFTLLNPGNVINGPAVIHTPITTIVVQANQKSVMDQYRNIIIELG